jgi:hypothetical protein
VDRFRCPVLEVGWSGATVPEVLCCRRSPTIWANEGSPSRSSPHRRAFTSLQEARELGVAADEVLKTVAVRTRGTYVLAVVPASRRKVTGDGRTGTARAPHGGWPRQSVDIDAVTAEAGLAMSGKGVVMAGQITLTDQEARALSSLLGRASDRLATYEEQTHQDRRLAEEVREAAGELVSRISGGGSSA